MSSPPDDLRILIVADDPLARTGLALLLEQQGDCQIVGQVDSQVDLLAGLDTYRPDVILWDLGWEPDLSNQANRPEADKTVLENLVDLEEAEFPVLLLLPDEAQAVDVWRPGRRGLLLRETSPDVILVALRAVVAGLAVLDPAMGAALMPSVPSPTPLVEDLTPRELEVLQRLAQGLSNKAIAHQLKISEHTVKFHVNAIMTKLSAQSRTEAVVRATRLGLILL
jgi:DNA-binding NarL/FixJ family response regulator